MKTIILDGSLISLQAALAGAITTTNPTFVTNYADNSGSGITEGATDGALNGVTDVAIVPAPSGANRRVIKNITIFNGDTAAVTVLIKYDNAATQRTLVKVTLAVGDTWTTEGVFDSTGSLKQSLSSVNLASNVTGTLPIANGGTGATSAGAARTALGLVIGTDVQAYDAQLADVAGLTPTDNNFIVGNGTNFVAESGATARTSLGLTIGTDVQAFDAQLTDIAGLTPTDNNFIVGNGTNFVTESGATARTSLGVGSIATQDSSSVTITGGSITGITDLAVADGGTGASTLTGVLKGNGTAAFTAATAGTDYVTPTGTETLTNKTLTNPTLTNYTESVVVIGTVGASHTLVLTSGTVQTAILTGSTPCTFTMPTATAGKSFILKLTQPAANPTTATFTGVKFAGGTAPTITATINAVDILSFVADGTSWFGSAIQNLS